MSPRWMSRPYAMARLLEHGALTAAQLREITGWDAHTVGNVLWTLLGDGTVAMTNLQGRRHYLLAAHLAEANRTPRPGRAPERRRAQARDATAHALRATTGAMAHNPFNLTNPTNPSNPTNLP